MKKLTISAVGAMLLWVGIYLFPFGQDIVIITLTAVTGSQISAWTALYFICFALIGLGIYMGGAKAIGLNKIVKMVSMLLKRPLLLFVFLLGLFVIFQIIGSLMGVV